MGGFEPKENFVPKTYECQPKHQSSICVSGLVLVANYLLTLDFPLLEESVCCVPPLQSSSSLKAAKM
jgi:hypothetical protein